ncbi:hypothetical protein [Teichococcus aestuarii]|uniref:hypothetical protein n=1 Tax=Teichococcus aestuarii TaxID=568898 RepID=UPI0036170280
MGPDLAQSFVPLLLVLGLGILVLPGLRPDNKVARMVGAGLTAALLLRYLHWRLTGTLPPLAPEWQSRPPGASSRWRRSARWPGCCCCTSSPARATAARRRAPTRWRAFPAARR